jgi:nitrogen fixation-related uncharacterized protein
MAIGVWLFVGWMALVAIIALAMFVWGVERDQFKHVEEPARRMLRDDDRPGAMLDKDQKPVGRGEKRDR